MQTVRQLEIMQVSMDIIAQEGIQGLTTKSLAKRLGISEPAIYRHFENKVAILAGILEYLKTNTELFMQVKMEEELPAMDKICGFFRNNFSTFEAHPSYVIILFSDDIFRNEPRLLQAMGMIQQGNRARLLEILERGQQKGEIRSDVPREHLALLLMSTLRHFVNQWHLSNRSFSLVERGDALLISLGILLRPT